MFVPLWHMPEGAAAGGLYRSKRVLETLRGFRLEVCDSDTGDLDARLICGRLRTYPARRLYAASRWGFPLMRALNWVWSCAAAVWSGLSAGPIEAVYVPNSELPHMAAAGTVVARVRGVPLIFGNLNVRGNQLWVLNRLLHRRADALITLSAALRDELLAEGIRAPIAVGSVGVDDHSSGTPRVKRYDGIYIARHTMEKGVLDLVRIAARCAAQNPALRIAMVGACAPDMRARLNREIAAHGVEQNLDVLGPVSEARKWELIEESRLCLFPSHVEGWGIVPIEAHLCGLEVVAYDLGAYEETIRHSPGAYLVPDGDEAAFAQRVLERLAAEPDRETIRRWARRFTWERAGALEAVLLRRAIAQGRRASRLHESSPSPDPPAPNP